MASEADCRHEPVYVGVVNITRGNRVIGAVDVWVCRLCKAFFCDEKRFGESEAPKELGFKEPRVGSRWAILVCRGSRGVEWALTQISAGKVIHHRCSSSREAVFRLDDHLKVVGLSEDEHRLYLVEQYVNKTITV